MLRVDLGQSDVNGITGLECEALAAFVIVCDLGCLLTPTDWNGRLCVGKKSNRNDSVYVHVCN